MHPQAGGHDAEAEAGEDDDPSDDGMIEVPPHDERMSRIRSLVLQLKDENRTLRDDCRRQRDQLADAQFNIGLLERRLEEEGERAAQAAGQVVNLEARINELTVALAQTSGEGDGNPTGGAPGWNAAEEFERLTLQLSDRQEQICELTLQLEQQLDQELELRHEQRQLITALQDTRAELDAALQDNTRHLLWPPTEVHHAPQRPLSESGDILNPVAPVHSARDMEAASGQVALLQREMLRLHRELSALQLPAATALQSVLQLFGSNTRQAPLGAGSKEQQPDEASAEAASARSTLDSVGGSSVLSAVDGVRLQADLQQLCRDLEALAAQTALAATHASSNGVGQHGDGEAVAAGAAAAALASVQSLQLDALPSASHSPGSSPTRPYQPSKSFAVPVSGAHMAVYDYEEDVESLDSDSDDGGAGISEGVTAEQPTSPTSDAASVTDSGTAAVGGVRPSDVDGGSVMSTEESVAGVGGVGSRGRWHSVVSHGAGHVYPLSAEHVSHDSATPGVQVQQPDDHLVLEAVAAHAAGQAFATANTWPDTVASRDDEPAAPGSDLGDAPPPATASDGVAAASDGSCPDAGAAAAAAAADASAVASSSASQSGSSLSEGHEDEGIERVDDDGVIHLDLTKIPRRPRFNMLSGASPLFATGDTPLMFMMPQDGDPFAGFDVEGPDFDVADEDLDSDSQLEEAEQMGGNGAGGPQLPAANASQWRVYDNDAASDSQPDDGGPPAELVRHSSNSSSSSSSSGSSSEAEYGGVVVGDASGRQGAVSVPMSPAVKALINAGSGNEGSPGFGSGLQVFSNPLAQDSDPDHVVSPTATPATGAEALGGAVDDSEADSTASMGSSGDDEEALDDSARDANGDMDALEGLPEGLPAGAVWGGQGSPDRSGAAAANSGSVPVHLFRSASLGSPTSASGDLKAGLAASRYSPGGHAASAKGPAQATALAQGLSDGSGKVDMNATIRSRRPDLARAAAASEPADSGTYIGVRSAELEDAEQGSSDLQDPDVAAEEPAAFTARGASLNATIRGRRGSPVAQPMAADSLRELLASAQPERLSHSKDRHSGNPFHPPPHGQQHLLRSDTPLHHRAPGTAGSGRPDAPGSTGLLDGREIGAAWPQHRSPAEQHQWQADTEPAQPVLEEEQRASWGDHPHGLSGGRVGGGGLRRHRDGSIEDSGEDVGMANVMMLQEVEAEMEMLQERVDALEKELGESRTVASGLRGELRKYCLAKVSMEALLRKHGLALPPAALRPDADSVEDGFPPGLLAAASTHRPPSRGGAASAQYDSPVVLSASNPFAAASGGDAEDGESSITGSAGSSSSSGSSGNSLKLGQDAAEAFGRESLDSFSPLVAAVAPAGLDPTARLEMYRTILETAERTVASPLDDVESALEVLKSISTLEPGTEKVLLIKLHKIITAGCEAIDNAAPTARGGGATSANGRAPSAVTSRYGMALPPPKDGWAASADDDASGVDPATAAGSAAAATTVATDTLQDSLADSPELPVDTSAASAPLASREAMHEAAAPSTQGAELAIGDMADAAVGASAHPLMASGRPAASQSKPWHASSGLYGDSDRTAWSKEREMLLKAIRDLQTEVNEYREAQSQGSGHSSLTEPWRSDNGAAHAAASEEGSVHVSADNINQPAAATPHDAHPTLAASAAASCAAGGERVENGAPGGEHAADGGNVGLAAAASWAEDAAGTASLASGEPLDGPAPRALDLSSAAASEDPATFAGPDSEPSTPPRRGSTQEEVLPWDVDDAPEVPAAQASGASLPWPTGDCSEEPDTPTRVDELEPPPPWAEGSCEQPSAILPPLAADTSEPPTPTRDDTSEALPLWADDASEQPSAILPPLGADTSEPSTPTHHDLLEPPPPWADDAPDRALAILPHEEAGTSEPPTPTREDGVDPPPPWEDDDAADELQDGPSGEPGGPSEHDSPPVTPFGASSFQAVTVVTETEALPEPTVDVHAAAVDDLFDEPWLTGRGTPSGRSGLMTHPSGSEQSSTSPVLPGKGGFGWRLLGRPSVDYEGSSPTGSPLASESASKRNSMLEGVEAAGSPSGATAPRLGMSYAFGIRGPQSPAGSPAAAGGQALGFAEGARGFVPPSDATSEHAVSSPSGGRASGVAFGWPPVAQDAQPVDEAMANPPPPPGADAPHLAADTAAQVPHASGATAALAFGWPPASEAAAPAGQLLPPGELPQQATPASSAVPPEAVAALLEPTVSFGDPPTTAAAKVAPAGGMSAAFGFAMPRSPHNSFTAASSTAHQPESPSPFSVPAAAELPSAVPPVGPASAEASSPAPVGMSAAFGFAMPRSPHSSFTSATPPHLQAPASGPPMSPAPSAPAAVAFGWPPVESAVSPEPDVVPMPFASRLAEPHAAPGSPAARSVSAAVSFGWPPVEAAVATEEVAVPDTQADEAEDSAAVLAEDARMAGGTASRSSLQAAGSGFEHASALQALELAREENWELQLAIESLRTELEATKAKGDASSKEAADATTRIAALQSELESAQAKRKQALDAAEAANQKAAQLQEELEAQFEAETEAVAEARAESQADMAQERGALMTAMGDLEAARQQVADLQQQLQHAADPQQHQTTVALLEARTAELAKASDLIEELRQEVSRLQVPLIAQREERVSAPWLDEDDDEADDIGARRTGAESPLQVTGAVKVARGVGALRARLEANLVAVAEDGASVVEAAEQERDRLHNKMLDAQRAETQATLQLGLVERRANALEQQLEAVQQELMVAYEAALDKHDAAQAQQDEAKQQLQTELLALQADHTALQQSLATATSQRDALLVEVDKARADVRRAQEGVAETASLRQQWEAEDSDARRVHAQLAEEVVGLRNQVAVAEGAAGRAHDRSTELETSLEMALRSHAELKKQVLDLQEQVAAHHAHDQQHEALAARHDAAVVHCSDLQAEVTRLQGEVAEVTLKAANLERRLADSTQAGTRLHGELAEATLKAADLERRLAEATQAAVQHASAASPSLAIIELSRQLTDWRTRYLQLEQRYELATQVASPTARHYSAEQLALPPAASPSSSFSGRDAFPGPAQQLPSATQSRLEQLLKLLTQAQRSASAAASAASPRAVGSASPNQSVEGSGLKDLSSDMLLGKLEKRTAEALLAKMLAEERLQSLEAVSRQQAVQAQGRIRELEADVVGKDEEVRRLQRTADVLEEAFCKAQNEIGLLQDALRLAHASLAYREAAGSARLASATGSSPRIADRLSSGVVDSMSPPAAPRSRSTSFAQASPPHEAWPSPQPLRTAAAAWPSSTEARNGPNQQPGSLVTTIASAVDQQLVRLQRHLRELGTEGGDGAVSPSVASQRPRVAESALFSAANYQLSRQATELHHAAKVLLATPPTNPLSTRSDIDALAKAHMLQARVDDLAVAVSSHVLAHSQALGDARASSSSTPFGAPGTAGSRYPQRLGSAAHMMSQHPPSLSASMPGRRNPAGAADSGLMGSPPSAHPTDHRHAASGWLS